jgi:hypothetical protein
MSDELAIVSAFLELQTILDRILNGEGGHNREALDQIFRLNTQIGRFAATNAGRRPELQRLQLAVNAVTSAIKRDDIVLMREAYDAVRSEMRGLVQP